ncbi:MAG: TolC family protein [Gemmatimonadaceae bacterium]
MDITQFAALALLAAMPLEAQVADSMRTARAGDSASSATGPTLTLAEAVALARRSNPVYRQVANDGRAANAAVRSAYGAFLPRVDGSLGTRFQEGGEQIFNGTTLSASSDVLQSSYNLGLSFQVNSESFIAPRYAKANREAVEAEIDGAASLLDARVTQQYLSVLQAEANAELQDTLVVAAEGQLRLAEAREAVGSATQLDVRRAEVALGQARVAALRAHNEIAIAKLRLFQELGVAQPAGVELVTTLEVRQPDFSLPQVLGIARRQNPGLNALEARERASHLNVRRAQSLYSPTLSLNTGWGGYTRQFTDDEFPVAQARAGAMAQRANCFFEDSVRMGASLPRISQQCQAIGFTDEQAALIRDSNSRYPFDFTASPWSFSATISLPFFDGFAREQRVQEAVGARSDARYAVKARELALTADVTAAYLTLTTAATTVELQQENAAKAREELALAEERYRVGAASFLDVTEARASFERAESERITAIYDYHKAFAALESAVGRPLR